MNSQLKMFVRDLRALISRAPVVTLIFILAMGGQMAHARSEEHTSELQSPC